MSLLRRHPLAAWTLCLLAVLLASLFGRPDIPIDETRYVSVAWEMWSGGDWLVLHRNGIPYHHKPPLLFWLINLGWWVTGVNDWWPRCISALFSLASLGLTVALARRLWPRLGGVGERAGWMLLGGAYWLFFSTSVVFDVMLTAFVLLGLLAALRAWQGERHGTWGLFALAVGLGVLAKGPVVLLNLLPVLLLAPWWGGGGCRMGWRAWYGRLFLGILGGALIALAWAVPAAIQGGEEYRNAIFWGQTAGRVSGQLAHRQPLWFYVAVLPLLLFPWFFWGKAWRGLFHSLRQREEVGLRFCLAWIIPAFIGFSLAGGKQAHYILPLVPAMMLLASRGIEELPVAGRWSAVPVALVVLAIGACFAGATLWAGQLWLAPFVGSSWQMAGLAIALLAIGLFVAVRGEAAHGRLAVFSVLWVVVFLVGILRPLAPVFDMVPLAQRIKALEVAGVPVAHASSYNDQYHLYGRLLKPLEEIGRSDINAWLAAHPGGRVVVYLKKAGDMAQVRPEFGQYYLEGAVVLVDAESAKRLEGLHL